MKPITTIEWIRLTKLWKDLRKSVRLFHPLWVIASDNIALCDNAAHIQFEIDCENARLKRIK